MIFACEVLNCNLSDFLEFDSDEGYYWILQAIEYREKVNEQMRRQ